MKLALAGLPLFALLHIAHAKTYGLGKSWLIGNGSTSSIQKVTTTLNPGFPPEEAAGALKLYPGLSNGTGDLLTTSLETWFNQTWCGATLSQWCIRTQAYSNQVSTFGQFAPLNANETVTIVFERSSDNSGWTQSAIVNDSVVSQLTYPSGPMTLFGMTVECTDNCSMTISPQVYTNTTIELDAPNLSWNETAVSGTEVYAGEGIYDLHAQQPPVVSGLTSVDGQLWSVEQIVIPPYD